MHALNSECGEPPSKGYKWEGFCDIRQLLCHRRETSEALNRGLHTFSRSHDSSRRLPILARVKLDGSCEHYSFFVEPLLRVTPYFSSHLHNSLLPALSIRSARVVALANVESIKTREKSFLDDRNSRFEDR